MITVSGVKVIFVFVTNPEAMGGVLLGSARSEEEALIEAEKSLRTDLDDIQQRLTTARQRVKAAGSPSY